MYTTAIESVTKQLIGLQLKRDVTTHYYYYYYYYYYYLNKKNRKPLLNLIFHHKSPMQYPYFVDTNN